MTKAKRARIERDAWVRYCEANWPAMLAGHLATAAKLHVVHDRGGHWIHIPATNCAGLS